MIHFAPSVCKDAYEIVLRKEDMDELLLLSAAPVQSIVDSIAASETAFTFRDDKGHIISIAGVSRSPNACHLWMLSSDHINQHRKEAVRTAKSIVEMYHAETVPVCNYISKNAASNRRFVQALGFVITDTPGSLFDYFYLEKTLCA